VIPKTPAAVPSALRGTVLLVLISLALCVPFASAQSSSAELYVIGIHPRGIAILDGSRDEILAEIPTQGRTVKEIEPSPDGKRVYVTSEARTQIEVVNLQERKVEKVFKITPPGERLIIFGMVLNHKGDQLYVHVKPVQELADEFKVLPPQIWTVDVNTGETRKILEVPHGICLLSLTRDDRRLVAWGRDLYYIDLAQKRIVDTFPLMTVRQAGQSEYNTLPVWPLYERSGISSVPYYTADPVTKKELFGLAQLDVNTGKMELLELGAPVPLYSSVVSPDRKRAYAVMNVLVAVDLQQKRVVQILDVNRTHYVLNISKDGKKLYAAGAGRSIEVFDTATMKRIKTVELSGDPGVSSFRALPANAMQ